MELLLNAVIPKDRSFAPEDHTAFSPQQAAVCDGASISYASATWADLLATRFVANPDFSSNWVDDAIRDYESQHDAATMSWSAAASYARGSFSTLLGVRYDESTRDVRLLSIGDSVAFLLDGDSLKESWPITSANDFPVRPELIGTRREDNLRFLEQPLLEQHMKVYRLAAYQDPRILCMTDALAEWALRDVNTIAALCKLKTTEDLAQLVSAEQAARRLRYDDCTLLSLRFPAVTRA